MKKKTKSLAYSLTLPAEILLIMYLEVKQKNIIIGTIEIATAKYVAPWLVAISVDAERDAI